MIEMCHMIINENETATYHSSDILLGSIGKTETIISIYTTVVRIIPVKEGRCPDKGVIKGLVVSQARVEIPVLLHIGCVA